MGEHEPARKVTVDVGTNVSFGRFNEVQQGFSNSEYYVSVMLSEAELRLKGGAFISAVRKALTKIFSDHGQVMIWRRGTPKSPSDSQLFGYMVELDKIRITDHWDYSP